MKKSYNQLIRQLAAYAILPAASLLLAMQTITAQSPGGVSANLQLWLKAGAGTSTTTNNNPLLTWTDQSVNAFSLTADHRNGAADPTFTSSGINFNPSVLYTTSAMHTIAAGTGAGPLLLNATVFIAGKAGTNSDGYNATWVSWSATNERTWAPYLNNYAIGGYQSGGGGERYTSFSWGAGEVSLFRARATSGPDMIFSKQAGTEQTLSPSILGADNATSRFFSLGNNLDAGSDEPFGNIAETIIYNSASLSATDILQIESYLALKYGITLDQTSPKNYVASDGTTLIWNAAAAASGFNKNIFGIGKDASSGLDQRIAQSVHAGGTVLTLATTNDFSLPNADGSRSSLADLNFETVAHNSGSTSWSSGGAPAGYSVLKRKWQVQETGSVGSMQWQFNVDAAGFDIPALIAGTSYYLVTDPNADGNYSDGTTTALTNTSGSLWSAAVDMTNGMVFTIATQGTVQTPGGVSGNLKMWVKANAGTNTIAENDSVTNWNDQSGTGNNLVADHRPAFPWITSPKYKGNAINFNPAVLYDSASRHTLLNRKLRVNNSTYFVAGRPYTTPSNYNDVWTVITDHTGQFPNWLSEIGSGIVMVSEVNTSQSSTFTWQNNETAFFREQNLHNQNRVLLAKQGSATQQVPNYMVPNAFTGYLLDSTYYATLGNNNYSSVVDPFGLIAEMLVYNTDSLAAPDIAQIESYMALKYGITLDQTSPQNYIASDGITIMWNAAAAASGFNHDIFGIGKDATSILDQRIAQSVNAGGGVLTLATTGNFSLSNADVSRTSLANLNFETIANNNGAASWTATGTLAGYHILERKWQVQETGTTGNVHLQFDVDNASFNVPALTVGTSYFIVTDPNADGDYSDGTATALTNTSGSLWAASIDFTNGMAFTLATLVPINAGADRTVCKNGGKLYLTGAPLTGVWTEQAGNPAGAVLNSTSTAGIITAAFTTNGIYHFIYTLGGMSDNMQVTVSDCAAPGGVSDHLAVWLKGNAGTGTTTDNVAVNTWADTTANAWSLTGSNTPLYVANGLNYNPAVFYNSSAYHAVAGLPAIKNSTVFLAGTPLAASSNDGYNCGWVSDQFNAGYGSDFPMIVYAGQLGYYATGEDYGPDAWNYEPSFGRQHIFSNRDVATSKQGAAAAVLANAQALAQDNSYFYLGNANYGGEGFGNIAETFIYDTAAMLAADVKKIESYLALKYGFALDKTAGGTAGDLVLSNGATIWSATANAGYDKDVVALVRDDASALLQKQAHTANDSVKIFVGSLAANNNANAGTIASNLSSLFIGSDGGNTAMATGMPMPAGIMKRFGKSWKIINNNFTSTFSIEIKWDSSAIINMSTLRLLVSGSSNFSAATAYGTPDVTFTAGSIIISGISNSIIPANSTSFVTVGSTTLTLLPLQNLAFSAAAKENNKVALSWQTNTETNSHEFIVEKSTDRNTWYYVTTVKAAGHSTTLKTYAAVDNNVSAGVTYYRLKQTDMDGDAVYSDIKAVKINENQNTIVVYPNPVKGQLTIKGSTAELKTVKCYNAAGQDVSTLTRKLVNNSAGMVLDVSALPAGTYSIKTTNSVTKIVKQ